MYDSDFEALQQAFLHHHRHQEPPSWQLSLSEAFLADTPQEWARLTPAQRVEKRRMAIEELAELGLDVEFRSQDG